MYDCHQVMCLLPVCVAAAGAVLQFDSRSSGCENSFPSLFTGNFELYLIMEWVGTSFAAVCLVIYLFVFLLHFLIQHFTVAVSGSLASSQLFQQRG